MSAPDTNIEKQTHRHRWSLYAIGASLATVMMITAGWIVWYGTTPETVPAKTDPAVLERELGG
ncbi:hypothetical protein CVM52_13570 [Pseudooceanicola lipolyticus]|uniref:Uncharacterized protein n=1 Tax=Pseudooceanicola lipolyticus TaxID=2029104 RepID=A0A2M8J034_9RHOB|nr:hypothetical protein [Pseudooceanicola lipolyticus]PJE36125.1 hypothetical protein CVM52_13570 [Pseudooceanicola lipolyticus]